MTGRRQGDAWRPLAAVTAVTAAAALAGCARADGATPTEPLLPVLLAERTTTARLVGGVWSPCHAAPGPAPGCAGLAAVGSAPFERTARAVRGAGPLLRDTAHPAALRARAVLALRSASRAAEAGTPSARTGAAHAGVARAVDLLERLTVRDPPDATAWNDLAAAYATLAELEASVAPLLRGLDAVERARALRPRSPEALYNRALLLDRLALGGAATAAWREYVAAEPDPTWQAEGRRVLDAALGAGAGVQTSAVRETLFDDGAPPAALAQAVRVWPQGARERGFALLGGWGRAVRRGDAAGAAAALRSAGAIAAALPPAPADRAVATAVAEVAAARGRDRRALATGYAALGDGVGALAIASAESASARLAAARTALGSVGSRTAPWTGVYLASARTLRGRYAAAERLAGALLGEVPEAESVLRGKTYWVRGVSRFRRGAYELADQDYAAAAALFDRARDAENAGAAVYLRAEALGRAGLEDAGDRAALDALRRLRDYPASPHLNTHLANVVARAEAAGLVHAAGDVADELVRVAERVGRPHLVSLAYLVRGRTSAARGGRAAARADAAAAFRWAERVAPGLGRVRARADAQVALGAWSQEAQPREALRLLREAAGAYRTLGMLGYYADASQLAARAAAAGGDSAAARALAAGAVDAAERVRRAAATAAGRTLLAERLDDVYDTAIALASAGGDTAGAFAYLERARAGVWADGPATRPRALRAVAARLAPAVALVEYAVLSDRLCVWVAARGTARAVVVPAPRDSVRRLVGAYAAALAAGNTGGSDVALHRLLFGAVSAELRGARTLLIVPDRELSQVAFAALRDPSTGRYLVADHELRVLPSAAYADRPARPSPPGGPSRAGRVLVVGEPAARALGGAPLAPLPAAAAEARAVAALYPGATLLAGSGATRAAVRAALRTSTMLHFAGHAVEDQARPEASYLVLAGGGAGEPDILRADEIAALAPSRLRLVVLAACRTRNARPSRAGGASGLAASFLRAGAAGVVGALWDVDDAATARLLGAFHARLAAGARPAEALRLAQLDAARAGATPAAWAGFVYTGR